MVRKGHITWLSIKVSMIYGCHKSKAKHGNASSQWIVSYQIYSEMIRHPATYIFHFVWPNSVTFDQIQECVLTLSWLIHFTPWNHWGIRARRSKALLKTNQKTRELIMVRIEPEQFYLLLCAIAVRSALRWFTPLMD